MIIYLVSLQYCYYNLPACNDMRFEVFMVVKVKTIFWIYMPFNIVDIDQCF